MAGGKKEKFLRTSGRRRKSAQGSSMTVSGQLTQYALTGDLAVDLPQVALQQGIEFMPPVRTVLVPPFPPPQPEPSGEAEGGQTAEEVAAEEQPEEPPPPVSPYQRRMQEVSEHYQFYQPHVRLQMKANTVQRDPDTGALTGPPHGIQISGWKCEASHLKALQTCFAVMDGLSSLSLNNAGLDEPAVNVLSKLLAEHTNITTLNLDNNIGIGSLMARLLQPPSNVQALSARGCALTDDVIEGLIPVLTAITSRSSLRFNTQPLRSLNLTNNKLTDEGAQHIARILRSNRQISMISLTRNGIGTKGAIAIAEVLQPYTLTHAEVVQGRRAYASVRQEVVERIESAIKRNSCCAGKCTHQRGRSDGDGSDRSSTSKRGGSRSGRSPGKKDKHAEPPPPPPEPPSMEKSIGDMMSSVIHPLTTLVQAEHGVLINPGNLVLANLSLAYNRKVGRPVAEAFLKALRHQQTVSPEDTNRLGPGLMHLNLKGTPADGDAQLQAVLLRREPPTAEPEPVAEEEEKGRPGKAGRQSEIALTSDSSRKTSSRQGRQRRGKGK